MGRRGRPVEGQGQRKIIRVQAQGGTHIEFGFLRWSLNLPGGITGANVSKATLMVFVSEVLAAGSVDVRRITSGPWLEDTVTFNAQPSLSGSSDGGGPVDVTAALKGTYLVFDVTELVQDWVDFPATNFGVALVGNDNVNMRFLSKESQTPAPSSTSHCTSRVAPAPPALPVRLAPPARLVRLGPRVTPARLGPRVTPAQLVPLGPLAWPVRRARLARLGPRALLARPVRRAPLAWLAPLGPRVTPVRLGLLA